MILKVILTIFLVVLVKCNGDFVNIYIAPTCNEPVSFIQGYSTGFCLGIYEYACDYENEQIVFIYYKDINCQGFYYNETIPFNSCTSQYALQNCTKEVQTPANTLTVYQYQNNCSSDSLITQYSSYPIDTCTGIDGQWYLYSCNSSIIKQQSYHFSEPTTSGYTSPSFSSSTNTGNSGASGASPTSSAISSSGMFLEFRSATAGTTQSGSASATSAGTTASSSFDSESNSGNYSTASAVATAGSTSQSGNITSNTATSGSQQTAVSTSGGSQWTSGSQQPGSTTGSIPTCSSHYYQTTNYYQVNSCYNSSPYYALEYSCNLN
ncbi:hypothetical protein DLAC_09823 [Tieghemostelium lacteum]|uniref:Uncharacterized protein n=1 Tax=Tieghemostelium lacteum TaxID=361077 RepID=A0A151Z7E1_TIELA|nr:hypothetical protein DLAC_09823 [Tieghemostelium lacteum]|eukprot:KYQ89848.1 hypothetical protein DLAC_09823 [Tieghemostelium lacteum]